MDQGIFFYKLHDGDVISIKEEFVEQFNGSKFLVCHHESCYEDVGDTEREILDLPAEKFEEYLWIDEDGLWYKVVGYNVSNQSGQFDYAMEPADSDTSEQLSILLNAFLDDFEEAGGISVLWLGDEDTCDGNCNNCDAEQWLQCAQQMQQQEHQEP